MKINWWKIGLLIVAMLTIVPATLIYVEAVKKLVTKPAMAAEEPATSFITVAGTGTLTEENGKFFVRGAEQTEVELGTIDKNTWIVTHDTALGRGRIGLIQSHYLGHYVTVIAEIEVAKDDEKVFRVVHTRALTIFRHSDGIAGKDAP